MGPQESEWKTGGISHRVFIERSVETLTSGIRDPAKSEILIEVTEVEGVTRARIKVLVYQASEVGEPSC